MNLRHCRNICDNIALVSRVKSLKTNLTSSSGNKRAKSMAASTPIITSSNFLENKDIFPDLPKGGPLATYRHQTSIDWRKLRLALNDEYSLRLQHKVWSFLENHPLFARSHQPLTMDEARHIATKRMFVIQNEKFFGLEEFIQHPDMAGFYSSLFLAYDPSSSIKFSLAFGMFNTVLRTLGTDRLYEYVEANDRSEVIGAFGLTEIAHGTNVKGMKTTATFDTKTKEYVLNSPDFEAAKCWIGNLGKTSTHSIIYAQLYTDDGKHHGLNAFLVPVRDTKTLLAHPGVIVGDLGEKAGLNGLDNGFVMFKNYRIPRENLLSKTGDVNEEGKFVSPIKDPSKRFGASLGALSGGRVNICALAHTYLNKAITIAIRYSGSRKQFGPDDSDEEFPVLEYQSQQFRLFPHLASTYAIKIFNLWFSKRYGDMFMKNMMGENVGNIGMEVHALSSAAKPVCAWAARDGIQECREACGGHGYLKVAGIGDLRNDNDANCTYEGENNVLIQQASNWLLSVRAKGHAAFKDVSPLGSVDFLQHYDTIIKSKFVWNNTHEALLPKNLRTCLNWLVAYLLEESFQRVVHLKKQGKSAFEVKNESQSFYARTLSIVYGERMILHTFCEFLDSLESSPEKEALTRLASLFGGNLVVKYMSYFYQGGFLANNPNASKIYQEGIINLLPVIKTDAISLIDAVAPTDFILNSALGMSNGEIYKNLESAIMQSPGVLERPSWWRDVVQRDYVKAKL